MRGKPAERRRLLGGKYSRRPRLEGCMRSIAPALRRRHRHRAGKRGGGRQNRVPTRQASRRAGRQVEVTECRRARRHRDIVRVAVAARLADVIEMAASITKSWPKVVMAAGGRGTVHRRRLWLACLPSAVQAAWRLTAAGGDNVIALRQNNWGCVVPIVLINHGGEHKLWWLSDAAETVLQRVSSI